MTSFKFKMQRSCQNRANHKLYVGWYGEIFIGRADLGSYKPTPVTQVANWRRIQFVSAAIGGNSSPPPNWKWQRVAGSLFPLSPADGHI